MKTMNIRELKEHLNTVLEADLDKEVVVIAPDDHSEYATAGVYSDITTLTNQLLFVGIQLA